MTRTLTAAALAVATLSAAPALAVSSAADQTFEAFELFDVMSGNSIGVELLGFGSFSSGPLAAAGAGYDFAFLIGSDPIDGSFLIDGDNLEIVSVKADTPDEIVFKVAAGVDNLPGAVTLAGLGVQLGDIQDFDLFDGVTVTYAPVPLPAAAWMLLAGAGALIAAGRKRA